MNNEIYTAREIRLANEIASTLHDPEAIPLYLQFARKHEEDFLRRKLSRVMQVEESKIKTSRGALFTFLVNQASHDPRP